MILDLTSSLIDNIYITTDDTEYSSGNFGY